MDICAIIATRKDTKRVKNKGSKNFPELIYLL